jgi:hydroxypyruvate reductase/glycerate 2-kinase
VKAKYPDLGGMPIDISGRRKIARRIFESALQGVLPERLVASSVFLRNSNLQILDAVHSLQPDRKVHIFGSGKASVGMAKGLLSVLKNEVAGGVIVTNQQTVEDLSPLMIVQGSHPVPDKKSIRGADLLIKGLSMLSRDDFFIYLLSGGSSSLIEKPIHSVTLSEMQEATRLLLHNSVPIQNINAIRKHLSMVKGGRLGHCTRAPGAVLVISDVIGDDLSVIGSGPLYHDPSSYKQCREILEQAAIWDKVSPSVRAVISAGIKGDLPETPKKTKNSIRHYLLGTNHIALDQACKAAERAGLNCYILTSSLEGEAREVAKDLVSLARDKSRQNGSLKLPACLLFGGETTVTVRGPGKGGRNQELALAALADIGKQDNILLLSGGTDGIDGNSAAAGAIADSGFFMKASRLGLSIDHYLEKNNSNAFFQAVGGLLETGATGTNVMDITLIIIDKEDL